VRCLLHGKESGEMNDNPACIVLCAWCNRYLRGHGDSAIEVSHGICSECADQWTKDFYATLPEVK